MTVAALVTVMAGCRGPASAGSVEIAMVNSTGQDASAWWIEGSSNPGTGTPYTLPACSISNFGFKAGTTTTVAVMSSSGRKDIVVDAPFVADIRQDVIEIDATGATYATNTDPPVLPSRCPAV